MTPSELGNLHPKLYHVTALGAGSNILEKGLYSTEQIVEGLELDATRKQALLTMRRPKPETFVHPRLGIVTVNDNAPLSESKRSSVLEDGLTPAEWLRMLNERVFLFPDWAPLQKLLEARLNKGVAKDILVLDTRCLAEAHGTVMAISPINTGSTAHRPARRGMTSFAPLLKTEYEAWRWRRGNKTPDRVKEISLRGAVNPIRDFVLEVITA